MTAYLLQKSAPAHCETTIFEAGSRLGGKIVSPRFQTAPVPYEAGAAELYDYSGTGPDPLRELVEELGLTTSPMEGDTVVLGEHVLSTYADIRRAFGEGTVRELKRFMRRARSAISPTEYYESDWKQDNADVLSHHSFRALLDTIPDEHARKYIEIAVHSDLATEPHKTSASYGLQNYLMNEPEYMSLYSIHGGLERLPQEIARRLTARILLDHAVTRVERADSGSYRITARSGRATIVEEFDFVVAALPINWLMSIDWAGETLSRAMRKHHAHYDHPAHYLRVSCLFDRPFWRDCVADSYFMLDAFGGCCVYDESSRSSTGGSGVLGWLIAGEAAATMSNRDEQSLMSAVLDSLPQRFGDPRPYFREGRVHRWIGCVNGLPGGKIAQPPEVRHRPEPVQHPELYLVGDYLFDSTLNGVLDSAEFVVEEIIEQLPPAAAASMNYSISQAASNGHVPLIAASMQTAPPG